MEPKASTANDVRRSSLGRGRKTRGVHAVAIWAACLAAGVGVGVLTDGDTGPLPRGGEPGAEDDRPTLRAPEDDPAGEQGDQAAPSPGTGPADEVARAVGRDAPDVRDTAADGAASTAPPPPDMRSQLDGVSEAQALAILEAIMPPVLVDPPLDAGPRWTAPTIEAPTTTTTRPPPASSSTTTTARRPGGRGPVITPLPGAGGP